MSFAWPPSDNPDHGFLLKGLFARRWKLVLAAFLAVTAANLLALSFPLGVKYLVDRGFEGLSRPIFYSAGFLLAACFLLKGFFDYLKCRLSVRLAESVAFDLKSLIFKEILRRPILALESRPSSEYFNLLMRDVEAVKRFAGYLLIDFFYSLVMAAFVWTALAWLCRDLAILGIALLAPMLFLYAAWGSRLGQMYDRLKAEETVSWKRVPEVLKGIRTIRVFGRQEEELRHFHERQASLLDASVDAYSRDGLVSALAAFLASGAFVISLAFSLRKMHQGEITAGTFVAVNICFAMLFLPVVHMALVGRHWREAAAGWELIGRFLNAPRPPAVPPKLRAEKSGRTLDFKDVRFSYDTKKPVLCGVSLSLQAGQKAAIVGPNGSGKTTLILLIAGLIPPDSGSIHLAKNAAFVLQDDFLFQGTVRENIYFGFGDRLSRTPAWLDEPCVADFILGLPEGWDTKISENFTNISSGQRQKIALMRALIVQPEILILDEPASFLDPTSEEDWVDLLSKHFPETTVLMISHRPASARKMDMILVMDEGILRRQALCLQG